MLTRPQAYGFEALTHEPGRVGEETAPGGCRRPRRLTLVMFLEIRNKEAKCFRLKTLSSQIAFHTVCQPRTTSNYSNSLFKP